MRGVARILGVLAAVCLVAGVTTALLRPHAQQHSHAAAQAGVRWRRQPHSTVIEYHDRRGRVLVFIAGPVEYDAGHCAADPTAARAFAGTVPADAAPGVIARRWADAIGLDVVTGRRLRQGRLVVAGRRADVEVAVPRGPCNPPRQHVTVVAAADRAVVLVRDEGVRGALPAAAADQEIAALGG